MRKIELLVPASSLEVLKIAVIFGADAVYIGGEAFGLRAKAKNFSHEDMKEGIAFAHEHGVKVYVTVNILAHNYDLPGVREYLTELKELKPDALIIAGNYGNGTNAGVGYSNGNWTNRGNVNVNIGWRSALPPYARYRSAHGRPGSAGG